MVSIVLRMNPSLLIYKVLQDMAYSNHSEFTFSASAFPLPCPCHTRCSRQLNYFLSFIVSLPTVRPLYMIFPSPKTLFPPLSHWLSPYIASKWPTVTSTLKTLHIRPTFTLPRAVPGFVLLHNTMITQFSKKEFFGVPCLISKCRSSSLYHGHCSC